MKHSKKREEITALIDNLKMHSDSLTGKEDIPILELSVILSKINRLMEKTIVLKHILSTEQEVESFTTKEETIIPATETIQDHIVEEVKEEITEIKVEETTTEETDTQDAIATSIEEENINVVEDNFTEQVNETIEKTESKLEEVHEETDTVEESTSTHDLFSQAVIIEDNVEEINIEEEIKDIVIPEDAKLPDLNEQYTEEDDPSLSNQLKKQPIADLLTAIGLNERYLYANELFDGDMDEFKQVIKILNDQDSKEEALELFESTLLNTYNWDMNNDIVQALHLLVERRYL